MNGANITYIPIEQVQGKILVVHDKKVILDADLAKLYGVTIRRLNEQVKRNIDRFPTDFMFRLNKHEFDDLKSHFATSSSGWGGRRYQPYVFTEHGAIMAASVLNSRQAVQASIYVVRAFVMLRQMLEPHKEIIVKFNLLEKTLLRHDRQIVVLFDVIKLLIAPYQNHTKKPFGFHGKMNG